MKHHCHFSQVHAASPQADAVACTSSSQADPQHLHLPRRQTATALVQPAWDQLARGIWFTALGAFAVGPSLFFALCAIHLVQWWNAAGQML
jgi:hypothetical protein